VAARLRKFVDRCSSPTWRTSRRPRGASPSFSCSPATCYTSSIIFLVGVELDELLREDAREGQRGVLGILGIAR